MHNFSESKIIYTGKCKQPIFFPLTRKEEFTQHMLKVNKINHLALMYYQIYSLKQLCLENSDDKGKTILEMPNLVICWLKPILMLGGPGKQMEPDPVAQLLTIQWLVVGRIFGQALTFVSLSQLKILRLGQQACWLQQCNHKCCSARICAKLVPSNSNDDAINR